MKFENIRQSAKESGTKMIKKTHTFNDEEYQEFIIKCDKEGFNASEILRSFIKAYNAEGRTNGKN